MFLCSIFLNKISKLHFRKTTAFKFCLTSVLWYYKFWIQNFKLAIRNIFTISNCYMILIVTESRVIRHCSREFTFDFWHENWGHWEKGCCKLLNIDDCFYLYSVPEPLVKRIIYQTLLAVNFCHQHNVRFILFIMNIYIQAFCKT